MKNLRQGDDVYYVSEQDDIFSAKVSRIQNEKRGIVTLHVFVVSSLNTKPPVEQVVDVPFSEKKERGTWHHA